MALYLGEQKVKLIQGDKSYILNVGSFSSTIEELILKALDNYLLADVDGIYLTPKEEN